MTTVEISIEARLDQLERVEAMVDQLYGQGLLPESLYGNVLVVATEATLNAIHHGSKDDASKLVRVQFEIDEHKLVLQVSDEGVGFNPLTLPDPTDPDNLEKGSGRGVFIIKNLSDDVEFLDGGSTLRITFSLSDAGVPIG